jgi:hypothetical protein
MDGKKSAYQEELVLLRWSCRRWCLASGQGLDVNTKKNMSIHSNSVDSSFERCCVRRLQLSERLGHDLLRVLVGNGEAHELGDFFYVPAATVHTSIP